MNTRPNPVSRQNDSELNSTEIDTIGEILNISMGAAATAVSILLSRQVCITTPSVHVIHSTEFEFSRLEPALGIEIKYVQGLFGSNHMIMRVEDVRAIVHLLLDANNQAPSGEDALDEIHISALGEIMNQMMGASCTALASFLDRDINISPPIPFETADITQKLAGSGQQDYMVAVTFRLMIEGLLDSEFITLMPVPFARELVVSAMGIGGEAEEEQAIPQVTGHTQVPAPMHGTDFQAAPKTTRPAPVAAAAPKPAPAPVSAAAPIPAPAPVPAAVPRPASKAAPKPAPAAMPAGGHAPEKAAPRKNVVVTPIQFGNLDTGSSSPEEVDAVNLGLVMDVDLNVTVEIGRTKKQVKEILGLRQGSIVELDKQAGAPVDIVVNGKLIARGDVVVIDENFGVRITEIVSNTAQK